MRLTITILSGTRAGQRFVLASGDTLRIGRTSKADVAVADDPTMSGVHYELHCGAEEAVVRDLESRNGLYVNNELVHEAVLRAGDKLRAGRTFFSVALDGVDPQLSPSLADDETRVPDPAEATHANLPREAVRIDVAVPLPVTTLFPIGMPPGAAFDEDSTVDTLRSGDAQRESPVRIYAVVDGSVAKRLVHAAKRANLRTENLLASDSSPYLSAVAPYLIEASNDDTFADLWQTMRDRSPGILIESRADFDEVLVHIRSLFLRKDDLGRQSFFRFYDPQLLYAWLQRCTSPQLESFFGCLKSVVVSVDSSAAPLKLTHADGKLGVEELIAG